MKRRRTHSLACFLAVACIAVICHQGWGQEAVTPTKDAKPKPTQRWLYVCCGMPGDDEHRERMTDACRKWIVSSEEQLGVDPEHVILTVGDEAMKAELQADVDAIEVTTIETMASSLSRLSIEPAAEDSVWLVLIGHALYYDGNAQFNIQGRDVDQDTFAKMAATVRGNEQVFWITTPVSGYWLRPLKMPGRVVVSATEPDLEYTGTEMPYAVADLLAGESDHAVIEDVDGDEHISLLDLYLAACMEVHGRFEAIDRLQTEHGLLDDNEDGRGSEIQFDYLPSDVEATEAESEPNENDKPTDDSDAAESELAVSVKAKPAIISSTNRDGFRSRHILLKAVKNE